MNEHEHNAPETLPGTKYAVNSGVVITLSHRYNAVRYHSTGSNN